MYPILVLTNRIDVEVSDDFKKAIEYFKSKNIDVTFDFKEVDQKVSTHSYKTDASGSWYGLDDYVKSDCAKVTPVGKYRTVIFAWNTKDVVEPADGFLTSWCNYGPLSYDHMDTTFIQLITNDYNDKVDWIYKSICHEIMHAFCANLSRFRVIDEMDLTILTDGQRIPYHKNSELDAPDGNFAHTFENLKPYMDKLYEFYYYDLKNNQPLKLGDKGERVKQLQRDLKALGYFKYPLITGYFGSITGASVKAFQRANKLVADGIAGKLTLQKIEELKKKPATPKTLVDAIIQVESANSTFPNGDDNAIGDLHLKDKAFGCMQIRKPVCIDVNKYYGTNRKPEDMLGDRALSIDTFNKYMDIYCKGKSDEYKARVWNGGPLGYKKKSTEIYWQKVSKVLYN